MDGIVETTRGKVRILRRKKPTFDPVEDGTDKLGPPGEKRPDPEKEALSRSSIRRA